MLKGWKSDMQQKMNVYTKSQPIQSGSNYGADRNVVKQRICIQKTMQQKKNANTMLQSITTRPRLHDRLQLRGGKVFEVCKSDVGQE